MHDSIGWAFRLGFALSLALLMGADRTAVAAPRSFGTSTAPKAIARYEEFVQEVRESREPLDDIQQAEARLLLEAVVALGDPGIDYLISPNTLGGIRRGIHTLVTEALLGSGRESVTEHLYGQVRQDCGLVDLWTFFNHVPVEHMRDVDVDELLPFLQYDGIGEASWVVVERKAIMRYFARVGTPQAVQRLVEIPEMNDNMSGFERDWNAELFEHLRSEIHTHLTPTLLENIGVVLARRPKFYIRDRARFDERTRTVVTEIYGDLGFERAAPKIVEQLGSRHFPLAVASARALGQFRYAPAYDALERSIKKRTELEFVLVGLEALWRVDAKRAIPLLLRHSSSKAWAIRSVVARGLGAVADPEGDAVLRDLLDDERWQVRKAAFEALRDRPSRELIDELIETLDIQPGRLKSDILVALVEWTDENFGPESGGWKAFWRSARETWQRTLTPRDRGSIVTQVRRGSPRTAVYFGRQILADEVVFIVDKSGSMNTEYPWIAIDGDGLTGVRSERRDTGIVLVVRELLRTVNALNPDQRFNVRTFAAGESSLFDTPTGATERAKKAARAYLGALSASGTTNLYGPLVRTLEAATAEEIYLLSDGYPTCGPVTHTDAILSAVRRRNRHAQSIIHTFSLGGHQGFLEQLAEENGGTYRRLDAP